MKVPFRDRPEKATVKTPDDRMTLTEHLAELRSRVIRSVLAIAVGVVVCMTFYDQLLDWMREPYNQYCAAHPDKVDCGTLQFLSPLEGLSTRLSISTWGGVILAFPVIMWQIWRFVVPALHAKEKKYAIPFILSSVFLFLLGGAVAYLTLNPALNFLISWAGTDVEANFQISKYVSLFGLMIAAFGIAFLYPVLLVFLQFVGVLTPQILLKNWRYAIVIIFVVAAVITPSGDPYSMMAMAGPMTIFYFVAVLIGRIHQKRRQAREAAT